MSRALITGIAGQDGSSLAESLLGDGWQVHGLVRSRERLGNIAPLADRLTLHEGDMLEPGVLRSAVERAAPAQIFHMASPTFVPDSWLDPAGTMRAVAGSVAELLEVVRASCPAARVLIASSREIYGDVPHSPQDEQTPCRPTSPYGVAKLAAHELTRVLRAQHGLHVSSAILFNHESPRRPANFVTRKITRAAAAISLGQADELVLGDLDVVRDWSAASELMRGCRLMLEQPEPGDYVLASGVGHSVGDFVRTAFDRVGVQVDGHLKIDQRFVRRREQAAPIGNPALARERLGWQPRVGFQELVAEMVDADLALLAG
ncbi:MAG: GDP-mannose 4,6-dehydratase [Solirubrobacteraceae bacterium]